MPPLCFLWALQWPLFRPSRDRLDMFRKMQREPLSATPTDVFVKHPYLFVPFLDRVSLNRLFSTSKEIHAEAGRTVILPWPEKRFRVASTVQVRCVNFSPDGGSLAAACSDGRTCLWNRVNGPCTGLEEHGAVHSVSFSPDGKFLVSGSEDYAIHLWKLTDSSYRAFEGHTDWVMSVAFSPDGFTIASGSADGSVRLWSVSEGRCIGTLRDNRMLFVWSVAWSPDGTTVAVADGSGLIFLWDISYDQNTISTSVVIQEGHKGSMYTIAYSPDRKYLASGSYDKTVKLWHVSDLSCAKVFTGHTKLVRSVCFSPSGKLLASGSFDGSIRLWNMEETVDGSCLRNISKHHGGTGVYSVAFSPDGRTLASAGWDSSIRLCEVSS
jgi:WD40 repeat protein